VVCAATARTASALQFKSLVNFDGTNGYYPSGTLVQGVDGNFYGTTEFGGANIPRIGNLFKVTPDGKLTTVYNFCSKLSCADGSYPYAGLALGPDGNLYGTTAGGGTSGNCFVGCGTVFTITRAGVLTTLSSFENSNDGSAPYSALTQGTDGDFYGTTLEGGANGDGTVYKLTPTGAFTTLYSFCPASVCPDGSSPFGGLIHGTDGNLYGTADGGGLSSIFCNDNGCGTVFTITLQGTLTTLHEFVGPEGNNPAAPLIQATNGIFYGTAAGGGFEWPLRFGYL
jgi:uncharacterized repeat protein (TIGR03803 family)